MLFWGPDALPCLYCYPDTHLLRRRSRVNMHAPPPPGAFPLFGRVAAAEALLEPGDVVFFPSRWARSSLFAPVLCYAWHRSGDMGSARCGATMPSRPAGPQPAVPPLVPLARRWAHYTESLDPSISVTCRFGGAGPA